MNTVRKQSGFTVTELLIVISIMFILMGIAVPSISEYRRRTELRENARSLEGFLLNARATARTRQRPVTVNITPTTYTSLIDTNNDGVADQMIQAGTVSSDLQLKSGTAEWGALPQDLVFNTMGGLATFDPSRAVIVSSLVQPAREFSVTVFRTGGTQVELTQDNWATRTRAW